MADVLMKTGKHQGLPMSEVPMTYLTWYMANIATPSQDILDELDRRAKRHGSRDSMTAACLLSSHRFASANNSAGSKRKKRRKIRRNRRGA